MEGRELVVAMVAEELVVATGGEAEVEAEAEADSKAQLLLPSAEVPLASTT